MNSRPDARRVANALLLMFAFILLGSLPGQGREVFDVPRPERISLSNTPGQSSSLSELAVSDEQAYLVWREEAGRTRSQQIRLRVSSDGGVTFGDGPSGKVLAVVPPHEVVFSVRVAARNATVVVAFSSGLTSDLARVSLLRSSNGGATFSEPIAVDAVEGGSPFPDIAVDAEGRLHLVVEDRGRSDDIFYLSSANEEELSPAINLSGSAGRSILPRIAAAEKNLAIVWEEQVES